MSSTKLPPKLAIVSVAALLVAGCNLAPTFNKPTADVPSVFKEDTSSNDKVDSKLWKPAASLDAADKGHWWKIFADPKLDILEEQAAGDNQSLKAAAARVQEARANVRANAADFLPNIGIGANVSRSAPNPITFTQQPYTLYTTQGSASYDPDLFGRAHEIEKAFFFQAEGTQATYNGVLLSLQADVAQDYFLIRALDDERQLLRQTVDIRAKEAKIMSERFARGDVGAQDDANARSDLASAQADLSGLDRQRATLEHSLAILLGQVPSGFSMSDSPLADVPPAIPGGIPSTVLERRPDIAAAIATMQSANQSIGAAKSAFFPDLSLTAAAGVESTALSSLFKWSSRAWALGQVGALALTMPIFDNGRHTAELEEARAAYDESVANYRQSVLTAFKEVEDGLSDQHFLYLQWDQAREAAEQASRATYLVQKRYDFGDVDYFEVVTTQRTSLAAEEAAVQLRGQRFVATVNLIRALGGGWKSGTEASQQPATSATPAEAPAVPAVATPSDAVMPATK
jgi:multidrug efflux system outer membrane protein